MSISGFFWYAGAFVLALGILIVVHEFGHFIVAKLCDVKVLRFSVGFGKPLLTFRRGEDGTEWSLGAFPLGGYVKMLDEREGPVAEADLHRAFNRKSVGRRALIVLAGPFFNLLLAVLIYWVGYMQGTSELRPVLGKPIADSIAARAGIQEHETVRSVSGRSVLTFQDMRWEIVRQAVEHPTLRLEAIDPRGNIAFYDLDLARLPSDAIEGDMMKELGLTLFRPALKPIIGHVAEGTPAAAAGIEAGDEVLSIDGRTIAAWSDLAAAIRSAPGRQLTLEILHGEQRRTRAVVPAPVEEGGKAIGRIGIAASDPDGSYDDLFVTVRLNPASALTRAVTQTWETSAFTLRMIGRMALGKLSWKNVSGPVTIADYAGQSARMGAAHYIRFLALISISLGVLNLLPIPILDGGHLMYYLAEFIKGGPLSERIMEIGQQIGLTLLVLLMAFAFYNDINRLVSG
jgi:regulator of sigma E protease